MDLSRRHHGPGTTLISAMVQAAAMRMLLYSTHLTPLHRRICGAPAPSCLGAIRVNFRLVPLQFNGADFSALPQPRLRLWPCSPCISASYWHLRLPGIIYASDGRDE